MSYLDRYTADNLPAFSDCVKFCDDQIVFSTVGIQRYKERFARAGFDIAQVKSIDDFERAYKGSLHIELALADERMKKTLSAQPPTLENRMLAAGLRGDEAEWQRSMEKLQKRRQLGLTVTPARDTSCAQTQTPEAPESPPQPT